MQQYLRTSFLISISIEPGEYAFASHFSIKPRTFICISVGIQVVAVSMSVVIFELSRLSFINCSYTNILHVGWHVEL